MHFRAFPSVIAVILGCVAPALAAPPAPKGPHPRLFLGPPTLATLKSQAAVAGSAAARAIELCKEVASDPKAFARSGYQGDNWAFPLSACALAYQLTGDAAYAATGVKLWRASLSDLETMGDKGACVPGANAEQATASVRRDTGYAIRFLGPHTALAYDWLHDAPGVDDALRTQSRACFKAWIDWYTKDGYLNDLPGANYHAGFVVAKALIAVAEGGEDGATSDRIWTETVDDVFAKQIVGKGLAPKGAMSGGDWPEGWQYGPLSVLHYALAARALEEQGVALPAVDQWLSDLALRFVHGLTPGRAGAYVGGDTSDENLYLEPPARVLSATLIGSSSAVAANWAAFLRANVARQRDDAPVFDALAEARSTTPADPGVADLARFYVAKGTRNVYVRTSWEPSAFWAVFTSAPNLVADHQHVDASNFVLSRGVDPIIVDPSPYGSRSTLTGNAIAIDSPIAEADYRPSQTSWSGADLSWVRATKGSVLAARADFAQAFNFASTPSDVPFARRDWVFLPEGEVVAIDRTRTDASGRLTHLRFRTTAKLTLEGKLATGKSGASKVAIHQVKLSAGVAKVRSFSAVDNCDSGAFGACTNARVPVDEYSIDLPGPRALAIHAIDALGGTEAPAEVASMNDASIDAPSDRGGENDGVIGAAVTRAGQRSYVVASSANDGASGATLAYGTPGAVAARHVVFDAPEDAAGRSNVSVTAAGSRCVVTIAASTGAGFTGRPLMFTVSSAAEGCKIAEESVTQPGSIGPGEAPPKGENAGAAASGDSGGCGCMTPRHPRSPALALLGLALLARPLSRLRRKARAR